MRGRAFPGGTGQVSPSPEESLVIVWLLQATMVTILVLLLLQSQFLDAHLWLETLHPVPETQEFWQELCWLCLLQ